MEQEKIRTSTLFVGLTRPPMVMGVTMEAVLINAFISSILFIGANQIAYLLVFVPIHLIEYLICMNEPRAFKLIVLKIKCILENKNRGFWKCNSYKA